MAREQRIVERRTDDTYESERVVESGPTQHEIVLRVNQFVWLLFGVLIGLIGLRVVLKLIAANPGNAFASFVYDVTEFFLTPFFGLTSTPTTQSGAALEISSIIAMFVYALLAWIITALVRILFDWRERRRVTYIRRERD